MQLINSVLAVAALLVASATVAASARGIQTCRCRLGPNLEQQGKLLGSTCYVVGVGRCYEFSYITTSSGEDGARNVESSTRGVGTRRLSRVSLRRQPGRSEISTAVATASPDRRYSAWRQAVRRIQEDRRREQFLIASGLGTVRPGSAAAVLAAEKGGDARSQALGQKALQQVYFLQALLGRRGRSSY